MPLRRGARYDDRATSAAMTTASPLSAEEVSYDVSGYEEFRRRALDSGLSPNQRAGFPDSYRAGRSDSILRDITSKLPAMQSASSRILDIGCGCSELTHAVMASATKYRQHLTLIDSPEMLDQLPDLAGIEKLTGVFPDCVVTRADDLGSYHAILAYSVAQYVFVEGNLFAFVDVALQLLAEGGALLIGDIPNVSMRNRFLGSPAGSRYHNAHFPDRPEPDVTFNKHQPGMIDDGVVLGLVARARAAGFQAFIMPQAPELAMSNRREDLLIRRP